MQIVAVTNQKGGVGKTTTAINLGAALAESGSRVAVIDLDPQGNASTGLGWTPAARSHTTYDLLLGGADIGDVVQDTAFSGLAILPGTLDLSSIDVDLVDAADRLTRLRTALKGPDATRFDYMLIDCPPSLNMLTLNALVAADTMVVPLQAEFFALEGLSQLMLTVREVRRDANPRLRIDGVVLTMYDRRNRLSTQVEADVRQTMGELVFETMIPRNVRLGEAPSHAMPILAYDPASQGCLAYRALAREFLARQTATEAA
jgi:chromosome partitioning protein